MGTTGQCKSHRHSSVSLSRSGEIIIVRKGSRWVEIP